MSHENPPKPRWIERHRLRYKKQPRLDFPELRGRFRTGDIILFHKTTRSGFMDSLELDFVSPLLFGVNEFRHSGVIVREGPVNYLKMQKSLPLFLTRFFVPDPIRRGLLEAHRHEMMCSEFVHSVLNRCGALEDYPSKLVAPYNIENDRFFRRLEQVRYSEIVRFTFSADT